MNLLDKLLSNFVPAGRRFKSGIPTYAPTTGIRAYYLAEEDLKTTSHYYGEPRQEIREGEVVSITGPVKLCKRGFHACEKAFDTLFHRKSGCMTMVELYGEVDIGKYKICAQTRKTIKILSKKETDEVCLRFALAACELEIKSAYLDKGRQPDPRTRRTIDTLALFIEGKATQGQLIADAEAHYATDDTCAGDAIYVAAIYVDYAVSAAVRVADAVLNGDTASNSGLADLFDKFLNEAFCQVKKAP